MVESVQIYTTVSNSGYEISYKNWWPTYFVIFTMFFCAVTCNYYVTFQWPNELRP